MRTNGSCLRFQTILKGLRRRPRKSTEEEAIDAACRRRQLNRHRNGADKLNRETIED